MPSVSGNVGAVASVSSVFGRNGGVVAANGDYSGVVAAHLTGATAATRYVGGTASGAPVAGTFAVGDFVIEQTGQVYVCTVAGTPGTWVAPGLVTREQFFSAPQGVAASDTALANLTWTKFSGDTLLDLSLPTGPTAIAAGVYAVTVEAFCASGIQAAGSGMFLQLDMDRFGEDASTGASFALDAPNSSASPAGSVALVYYLPAGANITAGVLHNVVAGLNFQLNANVQRLS